MKVTKGDCTLNGRWVGVAQLVEHEMGEFTFWFGVLDVMMKLGELSALEDDGLHLRFEDGRVGGAIVKSKRFGHSVGPISEALRAHMKTVSPEINYQEGEIALIAFIGRSRLALPSAAPIG